MKKGIIYLVIVCMLVLCGCSNSKEEMYDNIGDNNQIIDKTNNKIINDNTDNKENSRTIEEDKNVNQTSQNDKTNLIESIENGEIPVINKNGEDNREDEEINVEVIQTSNANLANKKCAWGFRRMKDNMQPEFSAEYVKPLDNYEGIYVGSKDDKIIYLTFDEGYENGYTAKILDTLKEKEVSAVFFVTMPYVKQNADLVKRMIEEGHIVGNHTVNHPSMPEVTDDEKLKKEIMNLHDYVKENYNYEMTFLRPPKGEYSERTVKISKDLGYTTVLWSAAYDDWDVKKQDRLDYARKMIYNNLHNGCVMLLHAVSKDNTALLPEIIDEVRNKGYEFYPLDEFVY